MNRADKPASSAASVNSTVDRSFEGGHSDQASVFKAEALQVDALPLEFLNLHEVQTTSIDESFSELECIFVSLIHDHKGSIHNDKGNNIVLKSQKPHMSMFGTAPRSDFPSQCDRAPNQTWIDLSSDSSIVLAATACSHGTCGVLDSGATKTVIGSQHVADLIAGFEPSIQQKLRRTNCKITFRFGNQGTLDANHALVVPLGSLLLQVAIVPGATPFLVSNSLIRALRCTIDTDRQEIRSPLLKAPIPLQLTNKGLYLIDINKVAVSANIFPKGVIETFSAEAESETTAAVAPKDMSLKPLILPSDHDRKQCVQTTVATQDRVCPVNVVSNLVDQSCHVKPQPTPEATSDTSCGRTTNSSANEPRGVVRDGRQLRIHSQRQDISGDVGQPPKVDWIHDGALQAISKGGAPSSHGIHRAEDSGGRDLGCADSPDRSSRDGRISAGSNTCSQGIDYEVQAQAQANGEVGSTQIPTRWTNWRTHGPKQSYHQ